jgi:hypothetical protein
MDTLFRAALSDRIVEARKAMARLSEIDPTLRLDNLPRAAAPFRRPEDLARFTEGPRKAGCRDNRGVRRGDLTSAAGTNVV